MRKKKVRLLIISLVISILLLCAIPYVLVSKDSFVVLYGIRAYRTIRLSTIIISSILAVLLPVTALRINVVREKDMTTKVDDKLMMSVKKDLEDLESIYKSKWEYEFGYVGVILQDVATIMNYYLTIGDEVKDESLVDLADTRGVLHKVIEASTRYMKHAIRVMRVMGKKDIIEVRIELKKCAEGTSNLRKKAQDFTMSVLDYIQNADANGEDAEAYMNSFKEVVLGEIDLIDKYIKGEKE